MRFKRGLTILLMAMFVFPIIGCKKNTSIDLKPSLNTANDILLSTRPFIYAFSFLVKAVSDSTLHKNHYALIDSTEVTFDEANNRYIFYFSGKMNGDSIRRYGGFSAILDNDFFLTGTRIAFTFQGYAEDAHAITAIDSLVNIGTSSGGILGFAGTVRDVLVAKDSVRVIRAQYRQTFYVDQSILMNNPGSAIIRVEGTGDGVSSMGYAFTSVIASALQNDFRCPWISGGLISFSIPVAPVQTGTIDFTKTECSDQVTYDFEGTIYKWMMISKYLRE